MASLNLILSFSIILIFGVTSLWGLESSKYEEQGCATVKPESTLQPAFLSTYAQWQVPIASTFFYNYWYEKFTNQSGAPDKIKNICLQLLFIASKNSTTDYLVAAAGAGKVLTYECMSPAIQLQVCSAAPGTIHFAKGVETEEVIVKSDNKNYIMFVQCIKKKLKSFYVMTPPDITLAPDAVKDIAAMAASAGFAKDKMAQISFATCPKPKPAPAKGKK